MGQIAALIGGTALMDQAIACERGGQRQIASRGMRAALGAARYMADLPLRDMRGQGAGQIAGGLMRLTAGGRACAGNDAQHRVIGIGDKVRNGWH